MKTVKTKLLIEIESLVDENETIIEAKNNVCSLIEGELQNNEWQLNSCKIYNLFE